MEQPVDDVLDTALSLYYEHPYKVNSHIYDLKLYFTDYEVKKAKYRYGDGQADTLLVISIRLPVPGSGKRVPLSIWLPMHYPSRQPIVHLIKSDTMFVNPACRVDENNIIKQSYLDNWSGDSTLSDLLQSLIIDFNDLFPAFDLAHFKYGKSALTIIEAILPNFPALKPSWQRTAFAIDSLVLEGRLQVAAQSSVDVRILITADFPVEPADVRVTYADGCVTRHATEKLQNSLPEFLRSLVGGSSTVFCGSSSDASTTSKSRLMNSQASPAVARSTKAPVPAPRQPKSHSPVPEEVHNFIQSADLSKDTETELIKKGFTSLRAIRCLQDGDVDKLELSLAEICLLKDALRNMNSKTSDSGKNTRSRIDEITPDTFCRGVRLHLQQVMVTENQLTLGEELGKGHSGVVYKGQLRIKDNCTSETVAVKTIAVSPSVSDKGVEDFIHEILQIAMLKHENVLGLRAVALIDAIPHLVLPFMANGDLLTYVKPSGRTMILSNFVKLALDVSQGMNYLHDHHIVHCDLAARNCLVDADGTVKVCDFGLSRKLQLSDYIRVSDMALAVRWMAPEVLRSQRFTLKSDLWSFAVVLWEIFTRGRRPYDEIPVTKDVREYIIRGYRLQYPDSAPNNVRDIMQRCWQMEPDDRPHFSDIIPVLTTELHNSRRQPSTDSGMAYPNVTSVGRQVNARW